MSDGSGGQGGGLSSAPTWFSLTLTLTLTLTPRFSSAPTWFLPLGHFAHAAKPCRPPYRPLGHGAQLVATPASAR